MWLVCRFYDSYPGDIDFGLEYGRFYLYPSAPQLAVHLSKCMWAIKLGLTLFTLATRLNDLQTKNHAS